jgi:acyl-[acyl-carrier-protein]-phospholipid O-acyltransferase/long-chain-fatty-acid--[acyl-carrier-protein] ligase
MQKPQKTRFKFAAIIGAYFAGTFNDNFCRQGVMLLAVAAGIAKLQSYITIFFTLPFIIFAAHAGYLSDRFSKRSVMIGVKLVSLIAYILGAVGLYLMSWPIIMVTVFILGAQSTIFSPTIYGSIPELYPADYVTTANGIMTVVSNAAILLGIAASGFVLDIKPADNPSLGVYLAAGIGLGIALLTFIISFFAPRFPATTRQVRFPWQGPWESLLILAQTRSDSLLAISVFTKAFFWFVGYLQILIIIPLGLSQFGLSMSMTSVFVVIEFLGIAAGSYLAPIFSKGPRWYRVMVPASLVMAASMFAVAFIPYLPPFMQKPVFIIILAILGIAGGVYSIPVTSFIQVHPAPEFKGRMIAASNLADFIGILLSGAAFYIFDKFHVLPTNCFAIEAIMVIAATVWLMTALPKESGND